VKTKSFSYPLPKELIARYPLPRGSGRLLVVDRTENRLSHRQFPDIVDYLAAGDVMVLNDTRVIPARLLGRKPTGGVVEVLLLRELEPGTWRCLVSASKKMRQGSVVIFGQGL
jgi:S-adenosylmethionine:tRNA ribosyltransferase-isomerase